jgi:hypothetical protein
MRLAMSLITRALPAHEGIGRRSAAAHGCEEDSLVYIPNIKPGTNMNFITRLAIPGLAAVLLLAGDFWTAAAGQGQVAGLRVTPVSDAAVTAPIRNAHGKVKSIVGRELTLDVGGHDMTFAVDENTDVLSRGAGRATRNAGGGLPVTDLVRAGDIARVSYRELNGWNRASEIQIKGRNTIASR